MREMYRDCPLCGRTNGCYHPNIYSDFNCSVCGVRIKVDDMIEKYDATEYKKYLSFNVNVTERILMALLDTYPRYRLTKKELKEIVKYFEETLISLINSDISDFIDFINTTKLEDEKDEYR